MQRRLAATIALAALMPCAAWAQATPEGARSLERNLMAALAAVLGPTIPANSFKAVPQGDRYLITTVEPDPQAPVLSAIAKPEPNGVWSVGDIRLSAPSRFKVDMQEPISLRLSIAGQSGEVTLDTSGATTSVFDETLQGVDVHGVGRRTVEIVHFSRYDTHMTLAPAADATAPNRTDVVRNDILTGLRIIAHQTGGGDRVDIATGRVGLDLKLDALAGQHLLDLIHQFSDMPQSGPIPRPAAALLASTVADTARAFTLDLGIDDAALFDNRDGALLRKATASLALSTDNGELLVDLTLGAEGLVAPELDRQGVADIVPEKAAIHLVVSGIPQEAVPHFLELALSDVSPSSDDERALFARGLVFDLESLDVDLHGARFSGAGRGALSGPRQFDAAAQISVENLDAALPALTAKLSRDQKAAVILVKGLARPDGGRLVWDVVFKDNHLLINGQDIFALMR